MTKIMLVLLLGLVQTSFAADFRWLTLDINLRYSDSGLACHNFSNAGKPIVDRSVALALEVDGDNILAAQLSNFPKEWHYSGVYSKLRLPQAELKGMKLYRSPKGQLYLKRWEVSEETLKWLSFEGTKLALLCRPPQPLRTILPNNAVYEFETEGLEQGINVSYSDWKKFSGKRLDERSYDLNLQFVQREYTP